jgi:putative intracellular protease/amidase
MADSNANGRVLLVLTSSDTLGGTGKPTGFHLNEFATPYFALLDAGYDVEVASIRGGQAPIDPRSAPKGGVPLPEGISRYQRDASARRAVENTLPIDRVGDNYRAVVCVGGHGTMWDFPGNPALGDLLVRTNNRGGVVAAICHGPAAFVGATNTDGTPIFNGRPVCCYSNAEEVNLHLDQVVPFLLESRLAESGAIVRVGQPGSSTVVRDGNLITGQNSASADEFAQQVIWALKQQNDERQQSIVASG